MIGYLNALDRRDPALLGEAFFTLREHAPKREKAGATYDRNHAYLLSIAPYDDAGGIAAEQAARYAQEFPDGLPTADDIDPAGE